MSIVLIRDLLVLALLTAAAVWDSRTGRIPNGLSLAGLAAGVGIMLAAGQDAFPSHMGGFLAGFLSMLLLYLGGGVGGGDVKLMAGVGLLCGFDETVWLLFYGGLSAAILGLAGLAWEGRFWSGLWSAFSRKPPADGKPRPSGRFALALVVGFVWMQVMMLL